MGAREQKGKEGSRMQPYCVSWRDLDSEALVLRSVLRPCFRLRLQHLPPATTTPSHRPAPLLHTARIRTYYAVWKCVWKGTFFFFFAASADCRHWEKSGRCCEVWGRSRWLWRRDVRSRSADVTVPRCYSDHTIRSWVILLCAAVLQTAHSGRQQSRFRCCFLTNCVGARVPL